MVRQPVGERYVVQRHGDRAVHELSLMLTCEREDANEAKVLSMVPARGEWPGRAHGPSSGGLTEETGQERFTETKNPHLAEQVTCRIVGWRAPFCRHAVPDSLEGFEII